MDIKVKVVGMEEAAAFFRLQALYLSVVDVAHGTSPAHSHQWVTVFKKSQSAGLGSAALLPHDSHVHPVGIKVQRQGTLTGLAAQKISPHKPFYDFDLIIASTLAGYTTLLTILSKCPEWDTSNMCTAKVLQKIFIQVSIQSIEWNSSCGTGSHSKRRLLIYPTGLSMQITENHRIIDRNYGIGIRRSMPGIFAGH